MNSKFSDLIKVHLILMSCLQPCQCYFNLGKYFTIYCYPGFLLHTIWCFFFTKYWRPGRRV